MRCWRCEKTIEGEDYWTVHMHEFLIIDGKPHRSQQFIEPPGSLVLCVPCAGFVGAAIDNRALESTGEKPKFVHGPTSATDGSWLGNPNRTEEKC